MHNDWRHENIPQVDGESHTVRNTDSWWEKNCSDCLKTFKVFKDVLLDIDEAPLSEGKKIAEHDHVTSVRMEVSGRKYIYCPPWNNECLKYKPAIYDQTRYSSRNALIND